MTSAAHVHVHAVPAAFAFTALAVASQSTAMFCAKLAGLASDKALLAGLFPLYLAGMGLAFTLQALFWMKALRGLPLSTAYPLMSLCLPINAVVGHTVFGEMLGPGQAASIGLLVMGVILVTSDARA